MKKRIISVIIVLAMLLSAVPIVNADNIIGAPPTGTEDDPFLIDSVYDFLDFLDTANNESGKKIYYALVNDINAWEDLDPITGFEGYNVSLDGNGHELRGFTVEGAMFDSLEECEFRNLGFDKITVRANGDDNDVAVLAKNADDTTFITSCTFTECTVELPANGSDANGAMAVVNSEATFANTVIHATNKFVQTTEGVADDIIYNLGGVVTNNNGIGYIVNTITKFDMDLADGPEYNVAGAAVYSETNIAYCYSDVANESDATVFADFVIEQDGSYAKEDFWITAEGGIYTVIGGESKNYSEMSLLELSAELTESVLNNYNEKFKSSLRVIDYASLWSIEDGDLFFSYDGKTGSVYLYVEDDAMKDATITFTDETNTEEIVTNKKYALRVGKYDDSENYVRNSFEVALNTKNFTMVENFILKTNHTYVKALPNEMDDGAVGTYSQVFMNSVNNGADVNIPSDILTTGITNKASHGVYPYCMTLSLSNSKSGDEIVDYRFMGEGSEEKPFLIHNFYELECLANHVNKRKTYFDGERYNEAYYNQVNSIAYPEDVSVIHTPIGAYSSDGGDAFKGTYDGCQNFIADLKIKGTNSYVGLFGVVAGRDTVYGYENAYIKNVLIKRMTIEDENVEAPGDIKGCLAGQISYTVVNGCVVDENTKISGGTQIGGVIGYAYNSDIYNCGSAAFITTYHPNVWTGGIVGYAQYCKVANCYGGNLFDNKNIVDKATTMIGGIAGASKKSEYDNTFYRLDNGADESLMLEGMSTLGKAEIQTAFFAADLTYYSESHGLEVVWKWDKSNFANYPYIARSDNSEYRIFSVPTNLGRVTVYNDRCKEISASLAGGTILVKKSEGCLGIALTDYSKKQLSVEVTEVTVGSTQYFQFEMPVCSVRIVPKFETATLAGCGTKDEPYMISEYGDLVLMSEFINSNTSHSMDGRDPYLNAYYVLTNDIDCEGQELKSIADRSASVRFGGHFDGQGYTISNLKIVSDSYDAALFGQTQSAYITDIKFDNIEVTAINTAAALVVSSYGYLRITDVEIINSKLNSTSFTSSGMVGTSYSTLEIANCMLENIEFNGPQSVYILRECDEYVGCRIYNLLILNMEGERAVVNKYWSTSSVTVEDIYHCNAQVKESSKYTTTEVTNEMLYDMDFIGTLTYTATGKLKNLNLSNWGARDDDGRAAISDLNDTNVISAITYDSIFSNEEYKFFDMATAPIYACKGDIVTIHYNLRFSTANIKVEFGNRTVKCMFDNMDNGSGYGTMTFSMPAGNVHITNNDMEPQCKSIAGKGTSEEPYVVSNSAELLLLADYINGVKTYELPDETYVKYGEAYIKLVADINMEGKNWDGIGNSSTPFLGTFDGDWHSIKNLNVNNGRGEGSSYGLFNVIGSTGVVTELYVTGAYVFPSESPVKGSGVIAKQNSGTISKVMVDSSSVQLGNWHYLGGIAGVNLSGGVIEYCAVVNTSLTRRWGGSSNQTIGGIAEENNGTISRCHVYNCKFTNGTSSNGGIIARGNSPESCYYYTPSSLANKSYGTEATIEDFSSGKITYSLNGTETVSSSVVWRQDLNSDMYPVLDRSHGIVYLSSVGYTYTNIQPAAYASVPVIARGMVIVGDVNSDNIVDEKDADMMEKFLEGRISVDYFSILACDVNGDGVVNKEDYDNIISYINEEDISGETLIGKYRELLSKLPEGTVVLGDLNSDGVVNNDDLSVLEKYLSGEMKLTEKQKISADTAFRNKIDKEDVEAIKEFLNQLADLGGYKGSIGKFVYADARINENRPLPEIQESEKAPDTGDSSNYILWISLLMLSSLGITAVIIKKKEN